MAILSGLCCVAKLAFLTGEFHHGDDYYVISTNGNWKLPMPAIGATTAVVRIS